MNKPVSFVFAALLLVFSTGALYAQESRNGHLFDLIEAIVEDMPQSNSDDYIPPTENERAFFGEAIRAIVADSLTRAEALADSLNYALYDWLNSNDNRHYYVWKEKNSDAFKGWGTFIFNPQAKQGIAIEIPHPLWDSYTWQVGIEYFLRYQPRFFLMAGTHRYANGRDPAPADVAHNKVNNFHIMHREIAPLVAHTMQIHGFSRDGNDNYSNYPDVVLSNGTAEPSDILDTLAMNLRDAGYSAGIFDGEDYGYLGATTNTQGQYSNGEKFSFIHIELEYFIRRYESEWENAIEAVDQSFAAVTHISKPWDKKLKKPAIALTELYPNPFNQRVTMTFRLKHAGAARIKIYDVNGQMVKQIDKEISTAGDFRVRWNGTNERNQSVASGMYIIRVQQGEGIIAQKIILMK